MTSLLNENAAIVEALGWTILHSLWQTTLLAGLLWLVSRLTRSARAKYSLAYGTLLAQLAASTVTFSWLYEVSVSETIFNGVAPLMATDFTAVAPGTTWWNPGMLLFWIVVFWAVGLIIGTIRLGISFGRVRRMQRSVNEAVPDQFRATVVALAQRIGYHGPLHLKISTEFGGPALVGHLKPLLLFPIAVVNNLSTEEAEAVILHELAHLKRQDHWWNLLQCVIEVIFYYHPVVWWIGARIREEREHCCDDLVLKHGPNRLAYAKALLYFEHQRATPATAVALTNKPSSLLGRVKRFLHQQNIPYQMKSRLFLLPLLTLIAVISTAVYSPAEKAFDAVAVIGETAAEVVGTAIHNRSFAPAPSPRKDDLTISTLAQDSLPSGRHKVSSYRNGSSTEVVVEDKEIKELTIDGKVIPEAEYGEHEAMVERLLGTSEGQSPMQVRGWSNEWSDEDRVYHLDRLEGLRSLESLKGLESLKSLEGLKGLKSLEKLEGLEGIFLNMEGNFENLGQRLGEMGEKIGSSFEGMIELHEDGKVMRFDLDKDNEAFFFNPDSLKQGGTFRFNSDGNVNVWKIDGKGIGPDDKASEIHEMETMIERLERRKAQMQRDLERAERDGERVTRDQERSLRDLERAKHEEGRMHEMQKKGKGLDYDAIVSQLQREGLLEGNVPMTKLALDNDKLKVNGKKASGAAHKRFLEIYKQWYGITLGDDFSVKVNKN